MLLVNWPLPSPLPVLSPSTRVDSSILLGVSLWVGSKSTLFNLTLVSNIRNLFSNHPLVSSYALNWLVTLPLELTAASITVSYWPGAKDTSPAAFVVIFWVVIVAINFFGVRGYGEAEFVFSIIKVIAVIGFILLGIIIAAGGIPGSPQGYIGAHYWYDPGAFNHGFKGLCSVFVTAAFSFGGTELVGLTAAETENPRLSLPSAVKQVFWRITLVRSCRFLELRRN
jgi:amino acid permease